VVGRGDVFAELDSVRVPQVGPDRPEVSQPRKGRVVRPVERDWIDGQFLKGPIPLEWLSRACELPGKALATALAVWFVSGLRGSREQLKLSTVQLQKFGVDRSAKSRALTVLEQAGLISVVRQSRKNPLVTILG
jgi:hypothetical protein